MTDDDRFDTWVVREARDYNAPPRVPRDAMWEAIRQRSAAAPSARARPWWFAVAPLAAAAAIAVVAFQLGKQSATPSSGTTDAAVSPTSEAMYAQARERHLERADLLLTSARQLLAGSARDPALDRWAREMLTDTRLLLDSPAATDAVQRQLLQDLELLLSQIVQLPAASSPDDRALVEGALRHGDLITRIRTAAVSVAAGT